MFGKLGDMMGKIKEAKAKMEEIKAKLATIEIVSEGDDVKVVMDGNRNIKAIKISDALQHGSKEELERLLIAELSKAMEQANDINEAEMKKVAMSMLPGGGLF